MLKEEGIAEVSLDIYHYLDADTIRYMKIECGKAGIVSFLWQDTSVMQDNSPSDLDCCMNLPCSLVRQLILDSHNWKKNSKIWRIA